MNRKNYCLPPLVAYMPVIRSELDISVISLNHFLKNSKRTDKFAIVGQRDFLQKIEKSTEKDNRLVYIDTSCIEVSSTGDVLQQMMQEFPGCDLIRVLPGVSIPKHWDNTLQQLAYQEPTAGTISPLCNGSDLFRLLNSPDSESNASQNLNLVNKILRRLKENKVFQVPVFSPSIVFFKNKVLVDIFSSIPKNVKILDDSALAEIIYHHGYINIISGDIYIHSWNKATDIIYKEIDEKYTVTLINTAHPASVLRHLATDALAKKNMVGTCQPVQLHIMHSWGGGLHKWVSDFCDEDKLRHNMVLKSLGDSGVFGKRLALFEHPDASEPIAYWDLGTPVQSVDLINIEYKAILKSILDQYGIDMIWVSSLIGHSLDALDTGVKTSFICHDYFPVCPAINIYYDGVCSTCDESKMASCFEKNEHNRFFNNNSTKEWFAVRKIFNKHVLSNDIDLIIPTPSFKEYLVSLQPELVKANFRVIPHGKESNLPLIPKNKNKIRHKEFHVVVLGELSPHKGQDLLINIIEHLPKNVKVHLIGCGYGCKYFKDYKNIKITPKYSYNELPGIIEKINPDVGLLLSIWPETFSYTLSELIEFGIPPVATRLGAFKDRVVDGENGFLFDPNPGALLSLINKLSSDKLLLDKVKENLKDVRSRKLKDMVDDYHHASENCNDNSVSMICVGNNLPPIVPQPSLILSNSLEMAIKEFEDLLKNKVNKNDRLKSYSKNFIIISIKLWLFFPRLISRINNR
jgi:glycosyltransferase involved in cell wall biosynthesis